MRRWILVLLMLGGTASLSSAEYLVIKSTLDKEVKDKDGTIEKKPLVASAVVEIKGRPVVQVRGVFAGIKEVQHNLVKIGGVPQWHKLMLHGDDRIAWEANDQAPALRDFDLKHKNLAKEDSPQKRVDLAEWALNRGLIAQFNLLMESVAKQESPPAALKATVAAYRQLQDELKVKDGEELVVRPLADDPETIKFWKDKFNGTLKGPYLTPHYAILYDAGTNNPAEVKQLGLRLERSFQGFYYWFALKGQALPLPKKRLTIVLIDQVDEFKRWHGLFDSVPLVVDGFYARRENLPMLSSVRQDEAYEIFRKRNQQELWAQGWNMEGLVEGKGLRLNKMRDEYVRAMTLAVLQKAMQEAGDVATCTHVGAEQLVAISGLIPRNVTAPEWIQSGMASLFETPKGALWIGYGGPHWDYLVEFKRWEKAGAMDTPEVALERVITDYYFHRAHNPREKDAEQRHAWRELSRMTAWSLTYFLAQRHKQELMSYFQELSSLPRDLEFDPEVLLGCFARAMNIADPTKPRGFNVEKMNALAKEWHQFIFNTAPPIPEPQLNKIHNIMRVRMDLKHVDPLKRLR